MTELASRRVREALAALASESEAPAAGVACALTCAAAASLVEMSAGLAAQRLGTGESADGPVSEARVGELRLRVLGAADDDVEAYAQVLAAEDGASRDAALSRAAQPPLLIAECASEVAEAGAETVTAGDWAFRADAMVGAQLGAAAAQS